MFLFFRSCVSSEQSAKTKRKNEKDLLFLSADQQTKHLNKSSRAFRIVLNTHGPSVKYYYLHEVATLFISFAPFYFYFSSFVFISRNSSKVSGYTLCIARHQSHVERFRVSSLKTLLLHYYSATLDE